MEKAGLNDHGEINCIDFSWDKGGTAVGYLELRAKKMLVEVESEELSKEFVAILKKRMSTTWRLKSTESIS